MGGLIVILPAFANFAVAAPAIGVTCPFSAPINPHIIVFSALVVFVSGNLFVQRAAALNPIDALRYD